MRDFQRILILGAAGQLGRELKRSFAGFGEVIAPDRTELDLANEVHIRSFVRMAAPDVILNAAAYTAVDRAESEVIEAMAINGRAPGVLSEEALRRNALLIHYSTDYVFDGTKSAPWTEEDIPNPLNVYGASKLAGEEAIRLVGGRYLIFRTSWVYGPHGNNFLLTMLRLGRERNQLRIVDDQIGAPTTSIALADAARTIVERVVAEECGREARWAGLYHMTCGGAVSWCGFAEEIFRRAGSLLDGKMPQVTPIRSSEYPTPAKRPANSVLSGAKLERHFGVHMPEWQIALEQVLKRLVSGVAGHLPTPALGSAAKAES